MSNINILNNCIMPRVFLVSLKFSNSISDNNNVLMINLGILTLREVSKQYGFNIEVFDGDYQNILDEQIVDMILEAKPQVIGFSPFQNTMERTINIIKKISNCLPETIIMLGGIHASVISAVIMNDIPEIKYIIKGPAEVAFPKLLLAIFNNQIQNLTEIEGLVYRLDDKIIENMSAINPELDSLPNLGLSQIPYSNEIALISSRGCTSHCSYCCAPKFLKLNSKNYCKYQSPLKVVNDIEQIINSSNNKKISIHFYDDDFVGTSTQTIKRAEEIADTILLRGISIEVKFFCQAKIIVQAGAAFWNKWKKAGLVLLFCGFESGSDKDLSYYNKPSSMKDGIEAYKMLKKCNICFIIGFIMFNPYSDIYRIKKNIRFLKHIEYLHEYSSVAKELFPFPATIVYQDLEKKNLMTSDKPYFSNKIKYVNQFIENIKSEIFKYRNNQLQIDRVFYELYYAFTNNKKTIELNNSVLEINNDLYLKYHYYKNLRAKKIKHYINKMLRNPSNKLSDIGQEMNNVLLNNHEEFILNITTPDNKNIKIIIRLILFYTFLKKIITFRF